MSLATRDAQDFLRGVRPGGSDTIFVPATHNKDNPMKIISTLGVEGVLDEILPRYEQQSNTRIEVSWDPTVLMLRRIAAGERADLVLATSVGIDELMADGIVVAGSRVDVCKSEVGIAVKAGAAKPDIATLDAVKRTLLAAKSIVYSRTGQSGIFFTRLIAQLGITDAVNAKATIIPGGFTAEVCAAGKAEIAIQQVSELMIIPGVDVVGPLPRELQDDLTFSGGIFVGARGAAEAADVLRFLARADLASVYRAKGLLPLASAG